jgi:hypothetical protein
LHILVQTRRNKEVLSQHAERLPVRATRADHR